MAKKKAKLIRVKLVRSPIGYPQRQKETVRSLGLTKMNQVVEHTDSPAIRGMVAKIPHLVTLEEVE